MAQSILLSTLELEKEAFFFFYRHKDWTSQDSPGHSLLQLLSILRWLPVIITKRGKANRSYLQPHLRGCSIPGTWAWGSISCDSVLYHLVPDFESVWGPKWYPEIGLKQTFEVACLLAYSKQACLPAPACAAATCRKATELRNPARLI